MKKYHLLSTALGAALLAGPLTQATGAVEEADFNFNSTMDLYEICSVDSNHPDFVPATYACRGFIEGSVQYHDAVTDKKNVKRLICYGKGTTLKEGRNAFLDWVRSNKDNEELMAELPVIGLVRALAKKYPCSQ